jgi:hypothetical protein
VELKKNITFSAGNSLAYPGPAQRRLTPAPEGKHPFYLSHFGRHGSRYMINRRDYETVLHVLQRADKHGKLSDRGRDVLRRVTLMYEDSQEKLGELTELGIRQEKDIARRMMERFPGLFEGDAVVEAHSTMVLRCVFSMENTLQEMLSQYPKLRITHTASHADMHILSNMDKTLLAKLNSPDLKKLYDDYCQEHRCWQRLTSSLFSDSVYFRREVNGERLNYYLFRMAGSVQNTDMRRRLTLYDLFTDEEIYENWQMENVFWFLGYSHSPLNGGQQPFSQRMLLRHIIAQADSCIALPRPGITLRFGHETALMPLVCLMEIDSFGLPIDNLNQLEKRGWVNYRVFPMGANVQMVFYRRDQADDDVLVKVLLNENEATLPLKTDCAPYYHWRDVRDYYLRKLDSYREEE